MTAATERVIRPTGSAPVHFTGSIVATATLLPAIERGSRYHEMTLYRTAAGKLLLVVVFASTWRDEGERTWLVELDDVGEVEEALDNLEDEAALPLDCGHPPIARLAEARRRLEAEMRTNYRLRASDLLARIPGAERRIP